MGKDEEKAVEMLEEAAYEGCKRALEETLKPFFEQFKDLGGLLGAAGVPEGEAGEGEAKEDLKGVAGLLARLGLSKS